MSEFNSKEFAWSNVEISSLGKVLTKARGVKFTVKKEKEFLYARGENPHSIQSGNKSYEGELMILQSEMEAMIKQLKPEEDITDLSGVNITVAFVPKDSTKVVTYILKGVEYTEDSRDMKQGDKFQEITLPFLFLERQVITS